MVLPMALPTIITRRWLLWKRTGVWGTLGWVMQVLLLSIDRLYGSCRVRCGEIGEDRHRNPKQFITRVEINGAELNRANIQ